MVYIFFLFATVGFVNLAYSQEAEKSDTHVESTQKSKQTQEKKSRNHKVDTKDAEGTKALNRFDTDPIVKSQYKLNGQALEVDTD